MGRARDGVRAHHGGGGDGGGVDVDETCQEDFVAHRADSQLAYAAWRAHAHPCCRVIRAGASNGQHDLIQRRIPVRSNE